MSKENVKVVFVEVQIILNCKGHHYIHTYSTPITDYFCAIFGRLIKGHVHTASLDVQFQFFDEIQSLFFFAMVVHTNN